ncbi:unnamed protein product, partial [marine sediment metagenome]
MSCRRSQLLLVALAMLILFASCTLKGGSTNMGYCFDADYSPEHKRLYVAAGNRGMHIFDVSRSKLDYVQTYHSGGYYRFLDSAGDHVYVAHAGDGLLVIDTAGHQPKAIWSQKDGPGSGVHVYKDYVFLAQGKKGLSIFNISTPAEPVLAGHCKTSGDAWDVWTEGGHAYVADVDQGVTVVDISDVRNPEVVALVTWDKVNPMAEVITGEGDYVYVASGKHGLVIIDVTEPTAPTVASQFKSGREGYGEGLAVRDKIVYLANGNHEKASENGLYILDVSRPGQPEVLG